MPSDRKVGTHPIPPHDIERAAGTRVAQRNGEENACDSKLACRIHEDPAGMRSGIQQRAVGGRYMIGCALACVRFPRCAGLLLPPLIVYAHHDEPEHHR